MNKPEETELTPPAENKTIMQSAKDFMNGVLSPLKGKDLGQLVEDFTAEMTLVCEGLSEDQQKLTQETDRLSAQQTELEQRMLDGFHDAGVTAEELQKELTSLRTRLEKAEKQLQDRKEKGRKTEGLTGMLRQATWLVGIASAAWIIVTVIQALTK